jgi:NADPH:quinone reductase
MSLDEVDQPTPAEGQLLVQVRAAGLNFPDVLMTLGQYQERPPLPFTPGVELCGEVVGTGQRVLGSPAGGPGAFAEYALMDAAAAWPVPEEMSDEQAASLYLTYQTGYVGLHRRAALQTGEWLLVHAGAGGVGSAAIQLGKAAGATVIATAGSDEKVEVCRKLGADHAINYKTQDFVEEVKKLTGGRGADVVYDPVGGDVYDRSTKCVAFEGRIVIVGFTSGRIPQAAANHVLVKNYSVVGLHWGLYSKRAPELIPLATKELLALYEAGKIKPYISTRLPLSEAPSALTSVAQGKSTGKVILTV